jgi:3-hydroxyacyl-[acyl-carrier-protein] dehydratase
MLSPDPEIHALIPHRPPFLWVDRIVDCQDATIVTEKQIPVDLDIFAGHYPGHPIMPGVLLCEAIFQSGALLLAKMQKSGEGGIEASVPVLARIGGARFKRSVYPGDTIVMTVKLTEVVSSAWFFSAKLHVRGQLALQIDFSCTLRETS